MHSQSIEYQEGTTTLKGYYSFDKNISGKRPAVLVVSDWSGCNEFAWEKAEKLAELGYVGFAIDMYGNGAVGKTKEEKAALMEPLTQNRDLLANRILAAFNTIKTRPEVDTTKIAAIGFCFGGLCVLDLARSGADVRGVVSFHGALIPPPNKKNEKIKAKVLVLHGYDDPRVTGSEVSAFETEMTENKVDWQVHVYGGTMHSFTNPEANDPDFGTVYNAIADRRSWIAMKNFLTEIF